MRRRIGARCGGVRHGGGRGRWGGAPDVGLGEVEFMDGGTEGGSVGEGVGRAEFGTFF